MVTKDKIIRKGENDMLSFESDYTEGAHEAILKRLAETNREQTPGYGADPYCEAAKEKIAGACRCPQADIYFLTGGTQTNQTVIDSLLKNYEGVIAAQTGHVNVHEAGAIEFTGHKVLALPQKNGKIEPETLRAYMEAFYKDPSHDHMVFPGMVYISHPTEFGTLYTKAELTALSEICGEYGLPLFLDGARLGYGLMSLDTDVTLEDIARLCDVFYIGGTKVGALFGEAVVITSDTLKRDFRYIMKQRGGMLAKGRLLGIQFETLFEDGLYFRISEHAVRLAMKLRAACAAKGYSFLVDSRTNQQFPILPNGLIEKLGERYSFALWQPTDAAHTAVRFCTSWATRDEDVDALLADIASL